MPDFNDMYELYDACTMMFFFRNKHIMVDTGTGNNNKINWVINDRQDIIDLIEQVFRVPGRQGSVIAPDFHKVPVLSDLSITAKRGNQSISYIRKN